MIADVRALIAAQTTANKQRTCRVFESVWSFVVEGRRGIEESEQQWASYLMQVHGLTLASLITHQEHVEREQIAARLVVEAPLLPSVAAASTEDQQLTNFCRVTSGRAFIPKLLFVLESEATARRYLEADALDELDHCCNEFTEALALVHGPQMQLVETERQHRGFIAAEQLVEIFRLYAEFRGRNHGKRCEEDMLKEAHPQGPYQSPQQQSTIVNWLLCVEPPSLTDPVATFARIGDYSLLDAEDSDASPVSLDGDSPTRTTDYNTRSHIFPNVTATLTLDSQQCDSATSSFNRVPSYLKSPPRKSSSTSATKLRTIIKAASSCNNIVLS